MPIADKVTTYSVSVFQNNIVDYTRQIRLSLESGGTATISFPVTRPSDWLQFDGSATSLFMTADQFTDVYRVLQSESPVFFTALDLLGLQVGAVHTDLDLSTGEPPGEGDADARSLAAMIRRARQAGADRA